MTKNNHARVFDDGASDFISQMNEFAQENPVESPITIEKAEDILQEANDFLEEGFLTQEEKDLIVARLEVLFALIPPHDTATKHQVTTVIKDITDRYE